MPTFDRIVEIGAPSAAEYTALLDTLEDHPYIINDGDPVSGIDVPGEFAFANAQGLIGWFDPADSYFIPRARFSMATSALLVAPGGGPGGLPVAANLLSGTVRLSLSIDGGYPTPVFELDISAGAVANGVYTYTLGAYRWLRGNAAKYGSAIAQTLIRYTVNFDFRVATARRWAQLQDSQAFDTVAGQSPATLQTRRYRIRHTPLATTFAELTDDVGKWDIVSVEPEGRRRYMTLECQRTVADAGRNVAL